MGHGIPYKSVREGKGDRPANQQQWAFIADQSTLKSMMDESQLSDLKIKYLSKEDKEHLSFNHPKLTATQGD